MNDHRISDLPLFLGRVSHKAVVNPADWIRLGTELGWISKNIKIPKLCLIAFFREAYEWIKQEYKPKIFNLFSFPIYVFNHHEADIALTQAGIGAPAAALKLEEVIQLGAKYIIFIGVVGVLDPKIRRGSLIVPTRAIRDEGTSFHYAKPARYAYPSRKMLNAIRKTLRANKVSFYEGTCWTTDAPYRETYKKIRIFKAEGCLCADMEASALFSVARFRKKHIAAIFSAGDCIGTKKWEPRMTRNSLIQIYEQKKMLLKSAIECLSAMKNFA